MCWNQSVSMNTFLFSLFAVLLSFSNGLIDNKIALLYLSFMSMQLVEYFAWGDINNKKKIELLSKVGFTLILLQPAISLLRLPDDKRNIMMSLYAVFILLILTIVKPLKDIVFSMHKATNGHLAWDWLPFSLPIALIWLGFFSYYSFSINSYWALVAMIGSFGLSYYTHYRYNTYGSMWCWICNALSIYLIAQVFLKEMC